MQRSPDLTRAENNAFNLLRSLDRTSLVFRVRDDPLEASLGTSELLNVGTSKRVAQKRLGEEDNKRLAELAVHLAAQNVEQVGRGRHVGDLHVAILVLALKLILCGEDSGVLIRELQVALNAARRVLRTLSVITVRKRHNKTSALHPLDLTRGNKLVDDALSVVGKVTELSLPHNKSVRRRQGVTILEAESTKFAQGRVRDNKLALVLANMLERGVRFLVLLVVEDSVTLGESSTLNILARYSNVMTLRDQRAECESLSSGEINVLAFCDRFRTVGENTLEVLVDVEVIRTAANYLTNVIQSLLVNVGIVVGKNLSSKFLGRLEAIPSGSGPLLGGGLVFLRLREALLEHTPDPALVLFNIFLSESTFLQKLVDIHVNLGNLGRNTLVHKRLGERRLISLVVAVLAVANKINNNIVLELGAPVRGKLTSKVDCLNIIGIDVENRRINGLGDVSAVSGGASKARVGRETDLVVDNEMNGTTCGEGRKRVEAKTFIHNALGGKRGIAVEQNAHSSAVSLLVVVVVLDSASLAQNNGVLGLQMRRVRDKRKLYTLARRGRALEVHTQMVLNIARTLFAAAAASEFAEDGLVGLADDVAKYIQSASVGHTNDNVLDTVINATVDKSLHTRYKGLTALKAESLVVGVLGGQESLEAGAPDEAVEDAALLVDGVLERLRNLKALAEPVTLLSIRNVNELNSKRSTVDLLASGDNLAESHLVAAITLEARQNAGAEGVFRIQVLFGESIVLKGQLLRLDVTKAFSSIPDAEGVDVGLVVAASLVGANEQLNLKMVANIRATLRQAASEARNAASHVGDQVGGRLEGLGDGHVAALHVFEVDLP